MNKFKEMLKNIKFKIVNIRFLSTRNKIKLNRNSNYNNAIIKYSKELVYTKENKNIEMLSQQIKEFLLVMERECKNFNPSLFIKNFKKTLFDISEIDDTKYNFDGWVKYDNSSRKNFFYIDNFKASKHELFHLATLNENNCGFKMDIKAKGLNEGYTQLLAERYFDENVGEVYLVEVIFVKLIEQIIGKDKMEKYYFDLDLVSLINNLCSYETEENTTNFINDLDKFLSLFHLILVKQPTSDQIENIQKIVNNICNFLFSCISNKLKILLSSNLLLEAEKFLTSCVMPASITIKTPNSTFYRIKMFDENKKNDIYQFFNAKKVYNGIQSYIARKKRN